jgi:hypothetical protein
MTMKTFLGWAAAFAGAWALAAPALAQAPGPGAPVQVVELYTSQGCSSCPPADAAVAKLSARPDILALSFGVTYWDDLGWKDTFAQKAFTERQWDYARGLRHASVATPQVVVNGRLDVVGQNVPEIDGALKRVALGAGGPAVTLSAGNVAIAGAAPRRAADVWLVRYDPNVVQVSIRRGENGGKTLPIKNVVRELTRLGDWNGGTRRYAVPAGPAGLRTAILVQAGSGGPILAAAKGA